MALEQRLEGDDPDGFCRSRIEFANGYDPGGSNFQGEQICCDSGIIGNTPFARSEKGILGNQGVAYKRLDCTTSFIINILSFSFGVVLTAKVDTKDITRSTAGSRL